MSIMSCVQQRPGEKTAGRPSPPSGHVLVLGSGTRAFLSVIRSLGRAGLHVHVGMCPEDDLALKSRYVRVRHTIPAYTSDSSAWLDTMRSLLSETSFDLVIPCDDPSLIPLQIHRDQLTPLAKVYTLSEQAFDMAFDKIKSSELAKDLGLCVPKQKDVRTDEPVESILEDMALPLVVKPPSSFTAGDLGRKRSVVTARTREDLAAALENCRQWNSALVQEYFMGAGVGVEVLADNGRILVAFQHTRVHEPMRGGGSSYRKSSRLDPELLAASEKLIEAMAYTGVAMVEFRVDLKTKRWIFIEINGRFWGSLPLAIAAGVDFPYYLYELLVHGRKEFPQDYPRGIHCRNLTQDRYWITGNLRADRSDPMLATRSLWGVISEVGNLLLLRERSDTLVLDDPKPGFAEIRELFGSVFRKVWMILDKRWRSVGIVRRRTASRALSAARRAERILFVCKGNICRSPFAELYAKAKGWPAKTITSSGYFPTARRCCPDIAVQAARTLGVDMTEHRSDVLNDETIARADVIFTFDWENYYRLRSSYPSAGRKLFSLAGVLKHSHGLAIDDPYSHEQSVYEATYRTIAEAVDVLITKGDS